MTNIFSCCIYKLLWHYDMIIYGVDKNKCFHINSIYLLYHNFIHFDIICFVLW